MSVELCVVCGGRGVVPRGFYELKILEGTEKCRRCDGIGTLGFPDYHPYGPFPIYQPTLPLPYTKPDWIPFPWEQPQITWYTIS